MSQETQDRSKDKWQCPVCLSRAYQRVRDKAEPAKAVSGSGPSERSEKITYRMTKHFFCKGCSVMFNNPNLFNLEAVQDHQDKVYGNEVPVPSFEAVDYDPKDK